MAEAGGLPTNPQALIRSKPYRALLVLSAAVGVLVSIASWGFLELVHAIQQWVYVDLPDDLGYDSMPAWWPLPWLALAGLLTAVAVLRLPGGGGHVPADGLKTGGGVTDPRDVPGILLAALATLGLGLVLGPESPLIALGMGLVVFAVHVLKKDAPQQVVGLLAAAGSFAAISTIFGSPIIGAVIIIEAVGLGGATATLLLLPGLLAAGIGSLVFIGFADWSGLSTSAWQLSPFPLPEFGGPDGSDFAWTIGLAIAAALVTFVIVRLAKATSRLVAAHPYLLTVAAGLVVGGLAIAFNQITDEPVDGVLFSGEDAFGTLFNPTAALSMGALGYLLLFKGLAWSISLGNFRGGPTFPALFLGATAGLLAGHLPGFSETPAVAVLMGAAVVSILRLPLASVVITTLLAASGGLAVTPLIILAVVVAYIVTEVLHASSAPGAPAPASPAAGHGAPQDAAAT